MNSVWWEVRIYEYWKSAWCFWRQNMWLIIILKYLCQKQQLFQSKFKFSVVFEFLQKILLHSSSSEPFCILRTGKCKTKCQVLLKEKWRLLHLSCFQYFNLGTPNKHWTIHSSKCKRLIYKPERFSLINSYIFHRVFFLHDCVRIVVS